jgi:uncharacterized repeat protein (TIGR03803 family)
MKGICIGLLAGAIGCALALQSPAASAAQGKEKVLHSFCGKTCTDGGYPEAGLIEVNGTLYGTTDGGGTGQGQYCTGCGTVFSLDPKSGTEKVLYSFCSQLDCTDGQSPFAGLIYAKGTLYGTTNFGGAYGYGTVFALDPKTGAETVLHAFGSGTDGIAPSAGLIEANGILYGTTEGGGTGCGAEPGCGTVFAVDPKTGAETVLYSFCSQQNCTDGSEPLASLIDVNGTLYGTTSFGGASDRGTVFALDPATGAETVIYSFCSVGHCKDGGVPEASLIDVNGTLYGTAFWGGRHGDCQYGHGCGTVFALDPNSGTETALYSFCSQPGCADGSEPVSGLVDVNGMLYGTTLYGGDKVCGQQYRKLRCGTVFALDPATGAETVLYSFCPQKNCTDGELPWGGLTDVNGALYGTTVDGGAQGGGTVFSLGKP